jgi:hypothetical protein
MKTFRWTVPEPRHADRRSMSRPELAAWQRARGRGVEWFVMTKGLGFMLVHPLLAHLVSGEPLSAQLFCEGWLAGMVAGSGVWLWRERRYERAVEEGTAPRS